MGKYSGVISGRNPVFVSVMYSHKARMRWDSVHSVASRSRERTSFSRRSQILVCAGQERMACWKDSGSSPQREQVGPWSSSNQEGWAVR